MPMTPMRNLIHEARTAYNDALASTMTASAQSTDCALRASSILGRRNLTQPDVDAALDLAEQATAADTGDTPTVSKFGRFRAELKRISMEAQQRTTQLAGELGQEYAQLVPHFLGKRQGPLCGARAVALEDDRFEVVCNSTGARMGITYLGNGMGLSRLAYELRHRAGA